MHLVEEFIVETAQSLMLLTARRLSGICWITLLMANINNVGVGDAPIPAVFDSSSDKIMYVVYQPVGSVGIYD